MNLKLICEPVDSSALWVTDILDGAVHEAVKKELSVEVSTNGSPGDLPDQDSAHGIERRIVVVIGYSTGWINETLTELCEANIEPILVSVCMYDLKREYSYVSFNTAEAMRNLVGYIHATGRQGIALFAVHRDTVGDRAKLNGFISGMRDSGMKFSREDIYYRGMVSECAERLLENIKKYQAVMCTSDLIAVYLTIFLRGKGIRVPEDINVTGFGNWKAIGAFSPSITRMYTDLTELGAQAVRLYVYMKNNPRTLHSTAIVQCQLQTGDSTDSVPENDIRRFEPGFTLSESRAPLYNSDPDIIELLKLEPLVRNTDRLDTEILRQICEDRPYAQISETLNISESTIKYRLSKMQRTCGFRDRSELLEFVRKYGII